jgi:imidazolonepropionase
MGQPVLVRGARQLLTLRGAPGPRRGLELRDPGLIQDGSVLVVDGVIDQVGPTRRVENLAVSRGATEIDATGRVVLPGFVDSHTHLVSGPPWLNQFERRLADGLDREARESREAAARDIEQISRKTLQARAGALIRDSVRHGTTTIEAKSGHGSTATGELKILRTHIALNEQPIPVVSTFMPPVVWDRHVAASADDYVDWLCTQLLPVIRRRRLAEYVDLACDPEVFTSERSRRLLNSAQQLGFGVKLHGGRDGEGGSVSLAVQQNAVSVDHMTSPSFDDMQALARSETVATLLPGPVFFRSRPQYAPARSLIDAGVPVALATSYNPESCPCQNMQMMIALACLEMGMTPAEAIAAATINGAHAVGRGNRIGSLERGKQADMLILGASDYREIPYHFGVNLVQTTIRRGEVIYDRADVTWLGRS